jgi:hypothetical protein
VEQLDYLVGARARFQRPLWVMNAFAHPGDAWQQAVGNVIAALVFLFSFYWLCRHGAAGVLPDGADPVVDRRRHCPCSPAGRAAKWLSPQRCCYAEPRAQNPTL